MSSLSYADNSFDRADNLFERSGGRFQEGTLIDERSVAHILIAALTAAGKDVTMTSYDPERMSLVIADGAGRSFDLWLNLRLGRPQPIGAFIRFVSEGAES